MSDVLQGYRVIDFTHWLFGPGSTQILGDFGADVIKIEPPGGERGRNEPTFYNGVSTHWMVRNRNKRSLVVNLRKPEGKDVIYRLARVSDVLVHNFRGGVVGRLGIDYKTIRQCNPKIVYTTGSGYGRTGPYADKPGQDRAALALSGLMWGNGEPDGPPVPTSEPVADFIGSMHIAQGIILALLARERFGIGQEVDTSLLNGQLAAGLQAGTSALNLGVSDQRTVRPLHNVYRTKDGYMVLITGFLHADSLSTTCQALEIEDLRRDPRFETNEKMQANAVALRQILADIFIQHPTCHWVPKLQALDIIAWPVNDFVQAYEDPQVKANDMVLEMDHPQAGKVKLVGIPVKLSVTPGRARLAPPLLGQHTDEVLGELGYSGEEIASLRKNGVVE